MLALIHLEERTDVINGFHNMKLEYEMLVCENVHNLHIVYMHTSYTDYQLQCDVCNLAVFVSVFIPSVLSRVSQNWVHCCCFCSSARRRASNPGFW